MVAWETHKLGHCVGEEKREKEKKGEGDTNVPLHSTIGKVLLDTERKVEEEEVDSQRGSNKGREGDETVDSVKIVIPKVVHIPLVIGRTLKPFSVSRLSFYG